MFGEFSQRFPDNKSIGMCFRSLILYKTKASALIATRVSIVILLVGLAIQVAIIPYKVPAIVGEDKHTDEDDYWRMAPAGMRPLEDNLMLEESSDASPIVEPYELMKGIQILSEPNSKDKEPATT